VARPILRLTQDPLPRIDMSRLRENHQRTRLLDRKSTPNKTYPCPRLDPHKLPVSISAPGGTGDDPSTSVNYNVDEDRKDSSGRLKGDLPKVFDGNRRETVKFLTEFKRFMTMNEARGAPIAKDPINKAAYFLSRIRGRNVEGWNMWMCVRSKKSR